MTQSQNSLVKSMASIHSYTETTRDYIQEKLLNNLGHKRPSSNMTLAPSSRNGRRMSDSGFTNRSAISQIERKDDESVKSYKLNTALLSDKKMFDNQKLEEVIMQRIKSGVRNDQTQGSNFTGYPNYYADYKPTITLPVTKHMTKQQESQGKKLQQEMSHRFFVAGMAPSVRPEKPNAQSYRSVLTDELDRAGADMSLKINQMKMISQGYSVNALETNQQLQKSYIAFGNTNGAPSTITDQVRLIEAEKFMNKINYDSALNKKDSEFQKQQKSSSFRRGFKPGVAGWVGQGQ
ncbi:Conserved_hypothetical protein [Hexamita inflata]|uniref:Uncharacterized protein n=1 Tax=Hexamita inflata TaxID=28002 RepID=A0AA86QBW5_9EUKA|nr:Conserved hypothetical protein [Hexamita inflata]CAI9951532.1 Conserved hypothetical protein [Hexamita inflata]